MWSKPAPPSASGSATPVRPISAAFLKSARGKWPVSSSSFANGRTSDSANSSMVFGSSFCSSVSSRSNVANSRHAKHLFEFRILSRPTGVRESGKRLGETFERGLQIFRVDAGFAGDGHEIGVADPARQGVQMQVSNDARARGAAQIHSQVHPIGLVICAQSRFYALRQLHHFVERSGFAQIQFRNVRVRHDHHVPGGVRKTIQDDEGLFAAMDDERFRVILPRRGLAKNAFRLVSTRCLFHVLVAPGSPDIVHCFASFFEKPRAQHNSERANELYTGSY